MPTPSPYFIILRTSEAKRLVSLALSLTATESRERSRAAEVENVDRIGSSFGIRYRFPELPQLSKDPLSSFESFPSTQDLRLQLPSIFGVRFLRKCPSSIEIDGPDFTWEERRKTLSRRHGWWRLVPWFNLQSVFICLNLCSRFGVWGWGFGCFFFNSL